MYFDRQIETMDRYDLRLLQLKRLRDIARHAYYNVPMYRRKMDAAGIRPGDIRDFSDLSRIPFTVKDDLRDNYPYGLFAVPMEQVVRLHASSGTTGKPIVVGYTKDDLAMWAEVMGRLVVAAGGTANDIAQVSFGYGLFTGAFGLHYALERVGATVVPMSSGNTERQVQLMRDFGSTLLISTPSYGLIIAETMEKMGIKKEEMKLRVGLFGAEASSEGMREELENRLGITATENYGLSEIIGPGVAGECHLKRGMHINEDHFFIEIINPDTGEVLPEGEKGEVVITTLTKQALPMLRYRTRDLSRLIMEPCECGRTQARLAKITGRSDDMLIIKGVNVFPSQIEEVLLSIAGIGPHYEIIVDREGYRDTLEVKVEMSDSSLVDDYRALRELTEAIANRIRVVLQLEAKVTLASPQTLKRFEGKAKRVTDLRKF